MKEYERTFQQWKELAERYFEAETTEAEEEALARFLATPAAQGKEFDELRAVMGVHRYRTCHIPQASYT